MKFKECPIKTKERLQNPDLRVKMPELSFHAVLKVATGSGVSLHLQGSRSISSPSRIQFLI
jgi:hypothetical protein